MIDVLDYMVAPPSFTQSFHLESNSGSLYNAGCLHPDGWIFQMKSPKGFPYDLNRVDENFVYQCTTEGPNGWADPTDYKVFKSLNYSNGHGGIGWAPRRLNADTTLVTPDSSYVFSKTGVKGNVGTVLTITRMPKPIVEGALGQQDVLLQEYYWQTNIEINHYARGFGWVRWQLWKFDFTFGAYTMVQESLHDTQKLGGTPSLVLLSPMP